jgi:hypothetical protein
LHGAAGNDGYKDGDFHVVAANASSAVYGKIAVNLPTGGIPAGNEVNPAYIAAYYGLRY